MRHRSDQRSTAATVLIAPAASTCVLVVLIHLVKDWALHVTVPPGERVPAHWIKRHGLVELSAQPCGRRQSCSKLLPGEISPRSNNIVLGSWQHPLRLPVSSCRAHLNCVNRFKRFRTLANDTPERSASGKSKHNFVATRFNVLLGACGAAIALLSLDI